MDPAIEALGSSRFFQRRNLNRLQRRAFRLLFAKRGIERCILLATQSFTGKLDEVVSDKAHGEYHVNLPAPDRPPRGSPEKSAIVRLDANMEDQPGQEPCRKFQVGRGQLAARRD